MKLALLGIGMMVIAFASCSITHKSGDYACTKQSDCNSGRVCDNGFCVIAGTVDAPRPPDGGGGKLDGGNGCPAGCTSCDLNQHSCTIDCTQTNCSGKVTCPTGFSCDVKCDTDGSCRNGVACDGATSCIVECTAGNSCQNVQCGAGPCNVQCKGTGSCRGVSCGNSCACDVTCTGSQSCVNGTLQCTSSACRTQLPLGCSSLAPSCHSC